MLSLNDHAKKRYVTVVLVLFSTLFLVSLFKNISYPLLWADESMTVMGGVRVLEYGYPKVHDGKNVFYDLLHPDTTLGIDEKTDAYIGGASWGQYYFATLGVKLAGMSDDFFTKTAIIRLTFGLAGLAGLGILAFLARQFFHTKLSKTGSLTLFVFFELISMPLVLHLREARYYPLAIFITALTIFVYARYRILKSVGYTTYAMLLIVLLFLSFFTFSPVYFIFLGSFFIFETVLLALNLLSEYRRRRTGTGKSALTMGEISKEYIMALLPVVISLIAVSPLVSFFKTFYIAEKMAEFNMVLFKTSRQNMYADNFFIVWRYFALSDFIYLAIFLKICQLVCLAIKWRDRTVEIFDRQKIAFSAFLTVFFVVYFVAICRIPNFPYTRYFIPLQPVLALIVILDAAVIYSFLSKHGSTSTVYLQRALVTIIAMAAVFNIGVNFSYLKGHLFEIIHQYRGPLDYVIPYIKERYPDTRDLIIATNYEETSFMYYLEAKVTMGYAGQNLEQDSQIIPDIIVYRKSHQMFSRIFRNFLTQRKYEPISFPVADWPANNLPELNVAPYNSIYYNFMNYYRFDNLSRLPIRHLFQTRWAPQELEKVDIYVRK